MEGGKEEKDMEGVMAPPTIFVPGAHAPLSPS